MSQDSKPKICMLLAILITIAVTVAEELTISVDVDFNDAQLKQQVKAMRDCTDIIRDVDIYIRTFGIPVHGHELAADINKKESYKSVSTLLSHIKQDMIISNFIKNRESCPDNILTEMNTGLLSMISNLRNWAPMVTDEDRLEQAHVLANKFQVALDLVRSLTEAMVKYYMYYSGWGENEEFLSQIENGIKSWDYRERGESSKKIIKEVSTNLEKLYNRVNVRADPEVTKIIDKTIIAAEDAVRVFQEELQIWLDDDNIAQNSKMINNRIINDLSTDLSKFVRLKGTNILKSVVGTMEVNLTSTPINIVLEDTNKCTIEFKPENLLIKNVDDSKVTQMNEIDIEVANLLELSVLYRNDSSSMKHNKVFETNNCEFWPMNWDIKNPQTFTMTNDAYTHFEIYNVLNEANDGKYQLYLFTCNISVWANANVFSVTVKPKRSRAAAKTERLVI